MPMFKTTDRALPLEILKLIINSNNTGMLRVKEVVVTVEKEHRRGVAVAVVAVEMEATCRNEQVVEIKDWDTETVVQRILTMVLICIVRIEQ